MPNSLPSFRTICYYVLVGIATLTIVVTLLSLLHNIPIWWIKVLDFPRPQFLGLALLCLLLFVWLERRWTVGAWALVVGLVTAVGWQAYFVLPYTPLFSPTLVDATPAQAADTANTVSLLQANVLMKNRNVADLLTIIRKADPDIVLLEETNKWWERAVVSLEKTYPYQLKHPLPDTYGMLLYSKFPLQSPETRFFQHPNVPSFHTRVQLPSGRFINLHTEHPVPPVPSKHPYNKHEKEEEMLEVGDLVDSESPPTLVVGDFNDVAWSNTSRLFQAKGRLNDVRVGRGLYPTFDAKSVFMRWPLDHVYATDELRVVQLQRLNSFGSDHFPLYIELALQ